MLGEESLAPNARDSLVYDEFDCCAVTGRIRNPWRTCCDGYVVRCRVTGRQCGCATALRTHP